MPLKRTTVSGRNVWLLHFETYQLVSVYITFQYVSITYADEKVQLRQCEYILHLFQLTSTHNSSMLWITVQFPTTCSMTIYFTRCLIYHIFRNISHTFDHQIRFQLLGCNLYSESTENRVTVVVICVHACCMLMRVPSPVMLLMYKYIHNALFRL